MRIPTWLKSCSFALAGLMLTLPVPGESAGTLKKWVDENGTVHYGDRIPPRYARERIETLNEQGLVIERKEAAKTPEQIAEERRQAARAAEEKRRREQAERRDRVLLDTFTNEDEMIMTRNGKIEAVEAVIRVTNERIKKIRERQAGLKKRAAALERAGKPIPDKLARRIAEAERQIRSNLEYIRQRRHDQELIRQKFQADIERFRELKAAQADEEVTPTP